MLRAEHWPLGTDGGDGENAMKGIVNDKKADGAKLVNFYFPRLMEGDSSLFREAQKALGPDFALPLICSSFSTVTRTISDSQQTIGTEIRTQHLVLCIPKLQREREWESYKTKTDFNIQIAQTENCGLAAAKYRTALS